MAAQTHTIRTDEKGSFNEVTNFNSPLHWPITVHNVYITITAPPSVKVDGSVVLSAAGKQTTAPVNASTGEKVSLGDWHIAASNNTLTITGKTIPAKPNTDVVVNVDHS
jgi:hypothetical protein